MHDKHESTDTDERDGRHLNAAALEHDVVYTDPDTPKKILKKMEDRTLGRAEYIDELLRIHPELDEDLSLLESFLNGDKPNIVFKSERLLQAFLSEEKPSYLELLKRQGFEPQFTDMEAFFEEAGVSLPAVPERGSIEPSTSADLSSEALATDKATGEAEAVDSPKAESTQAKILHHQADTPTRSNQTRKAKPKRRSRVSMSSPNVPRATAPRNTTRAVTRKRRVSLQNPGLMSDQELVSTVSNRVLSTRGSAQRGVGMTIATARIVADELSRRIKTSSSPDVFIDPAVRLAHWELGGVRSDIREQMREVVGEACKRCGMSLLKVVRYASVNTGQMSKIAFSILNRSSEEILAAKPGESAAKYKESMQEEEHNELREKLSALAAELPTKVGLLDLTARSEREVHLSIQELARAVSA